MDSYSGPSHGGDIYATARRLRVSPDKLLDFSCNANVFARHITEALVLGTPYPYLHYPDTTTHELVEALSAYESLESDRILTGNGASELIWMALRALEPRKILFVGPIFSEYVGACKAMSIPFDILTPSQGNDFVCTPENLERLWETDADLVIMCTPNNPAGVTYPNIHNMLNMLRAPRVLIDNSYREFLFGTSSYTDNHIHEYAKTCRPGVSLFTLHSFTKFFCCPGIRLGYLLGDRTQIARIRTQRPSWSISSFAQIMGKTFLENIDLYRKTLPALYSSVSHLGRELRRMKICNPERIIEGPGFICSGLADGRSAPIVARDLLNQRLLVRDCDSIPGMPPGYIRIQARPEQDMDRLLTAMDALSDQ